MSINHVNSEPPRSKLVELFGRSKTLPNVDKPHEETGTSAVKTTRTKTVDHISDSNVTNVSSSNNSPLKKQPSGEKLTSLPKLSRRGSNPRSHPKRNDLAKERLSTSVGQRSKSKQADATLCGLDIGANNDVTNSKYDRKSNGDYRKYPRKEEKKANTQKSSGQGEKLISRSSIDDDYEDLDILRNAGHVVSINDGKSIADESNNSQDKRTGDLEDPLSSMDVQPMSPINRYSGGSQGSLMSRISQRYIIDPARLSSPKHPQTSSSSPSSSGLMTTTTQMTILDGMVEEMRMNQSLIEASKPMKRKDVDDDGEEGIYCNSADSLSTTNLPSKPSSDGALFSGQSSSFCNLKTCKPHQEPTPSSVGQRVRSATNPQTSSFDTIKIPSEISEGNHFGFKTTKRYERSTSLSGLGGNSSTNLLPSLTLTSIPERGMTLESEDQGCHTLLTRPKVLDLSRSRGMMDYNGYQQARQSLDSARFLRQPEIVGSPMIFTRKQNLSSPLSTPDTGSRWNAASSSSSSSLLSPPQHDPKRFHSSLPRSNKSPSAGGLSSHKYQDTLRFGISGTSSKSPGIDTYEKGTKGFSFSASHINNNPHLDSNGQRRIHMYKGQGSMPLPGSQSCCLSRKNITTSPCQQQQSPLKSLYSLDEDGDLHASVLSLISNTSSSVFSTMTEERQAQEIKRLRHELDSANDKINSLTNQLNTNVYVVGAFEHSLSTMTSRLQKLTKSSELKDVELTKLKTALEEIERAKGQMSRTFNDQSTLVSAEFKLKKGIIIDDDPSRFNSTLTPQNQSQMSFDSMEGKRKNLLWAKLGHTFKRAFSKKKDGSDSETDVSCSSEFVATTPLKSPNLPCRRHSNHHLAGYRSVPSTPLVSQRRIMELFESPSSKNVQSKNTPNSKSPVPNSVDVMATSDDKVDATEADKLVASLQQQLHEKEMGLTEVRLEALSSAHMLEQLRETINQLKLELNQERSENDRLRQLLEDNDLDISQSKVNKINPERQRSINKSNIDDQSKFLIREPPTSYGSLPLDDMKKSVPKYIVAVRTRSNDGKDILVGSVSLTSKTKWETLDSTVNRIFQEYLYKVDAVNILGLSSKSISFYRVGELKRTKGDTLPELLPCGYLVGHYTTIVIWLNDNLGQPSLDLTSFMTLLSKKSLERYICLVQSYMNLIIVGSVSCGKSSLVHQLAHCVSLSATTGKKSPITYIDINAISDEEFRIFIADMPSSSSSSPSSSSSSSLSSSSPSSSLSAADMIIIMDNLTHSIITSHSFIEFVESCARKRKFLLGTMLTSQYRASRDMITAKIQVSVLDSQSEPLQGLLSRHLQRKVIEEEIKRDRKLDADVLRYLKYLVQVHEHLCTFIRDQCCQTVDELGPLIFFTAPLDKNQFQSWFVELWNDRIIPHLTSALSDHLKPNCTTHHDPTSWVRDHLPWSSKELLGLTSSPPPDLLLTSNRGQKVQDDDNDVCDDNENSVRLINTNAYQLPSLSSSASPSSSAAISSLRSRLPVQSPSSSSLYPQTSNSDNNLINNNYDNINNQCRHHHHHFARSPNVVRKNKQVKEIDPLTNMLHRLQEAAMTSTTTSSDGFYDNINNINNNKYFTNNSVTSSNDAIFTVDSSCGVSGDGSSF